MAFTKKAKATPKPASYARKSKKQAPVEEPEVEETESDYEDAPEPAEEQEQEDYQEEEPEEEQERPRPSRGYSSNNYATPARPAQQQRSQYGARRNSQGPQGSQDGKGVRVTGLFAGKREGLWTGRLRKEDIDNLMGLFDSALNSNQLITMFLWENQDGPQFSLTANVAQEFKGGGGGNRFNRGYRGSIGRR